MTSTRTANGYAYNIVKDAFGGTFIMDSDETKTFAYIPPRQTQTNVEFKDDYVEGDVVEVQSALEGTLVCVFWNPDISRWEVSTRNGVGCSYSFTRPISKDQPVKTFREMIVDVFRLRLYMQYKAESDDVRTLEDAFTLNELPKDLCYTCVLQHPDNHIVYPSIPYVFYLKIVGVHRGTESIPRGEWGAACSVFDCNRLRVESLSKTAELSSFQSELFKSYEELTEEQTKELQFDSSDLANTESAFYPPAWILKNTRTGHVCEIANPFYEAAKAKRNMQPNTRFLYLTLLKDGHEKVEDYVNTFPKYRNEFSTFAKEYAELADGIYNTYVQYYILKKREKSYPKQHFVNAARLHHNVYLPSIADASGKKPSINLATVYKYLEGLSATKLFYYSTYV